MASVLVVEDESSLRHTLANSLEREGHSVTSTGEVAEAIEVGATAQTDVLVTDWMLRNHLHGLHLSRALQLVHPQLSTIVITGFPSRELAAASKRGRIDRLLHKPFSLSELHGALAGLHCEAESDASHRETGVGLLHVGLDESIQFISARANELIAEFTAGPAPSSWSELIAEPFDAWCSEASRDWVELTPRAGKRAWSMRAVPTEHCGGWRFLVCPAAEDGWRSDPRIGALLGEGWMHGRRDLGPLIAIERDGGVRRVLDSQLERLGSVCYHADDLEGAIRLLAVETRTRSLVIDLDAAGMALESWVRQVRQVAPGVRIIGAGAAAAEDLSASGLDDVLPKPWRLVDLLGVLEAD